MAVALVPAAAPFKSKTGATAAATSVIVLETCVVFAVHLHWDPAPQDIDPDVTRRSVVDLLVAGLRP